MAENSGSGDKKKISNNFKIVGVSSLSGMARGLIGFPLEQPLEAVKTQWQAKPMHRNEYIIAKQIYKEKGIINGFFAGSTPNLARILFKNFYRYPLMVQLPNFYQQHLPSSICENKKYQKLFTGISIAFVEGFLICPFERLKTYFMTVNA